MGLRHYRSKFRIQWIQCIWSKYRVACILFGLEWSVLLIVVVLAYLHLGSMVQDSINQALVVGPDSDLFQLWRNPPIHPTMSMFLFNITNSEQWLDGSDDQLKVEQVGPYSYEESWEKTDIHFHSANDTVTYRVIKKYIFLKEKSNGNNPELDVVIMPNIPLHSAAASMKGASYFTQMGFSAAMDLMQGKSLQPVFVTRTVHEMIWGYPDPLTEMAATFMPMDNMDPSNPGHFGLLMGKNNTPDGPFNVFTGRDDLSKLGQVVSFKDKHFYGVWGLGCDRISGGEGSFNPPRLDMNSELNILVPDLCRSLKLIPDRKTMLDGIEGLRFIPHPNVFNYRSPENKCYCATSKQEVTEEDDGFGNWFQDADSSEENDPVLENDESCSGEGFFELGPCAMGAPLVASWPHFLDSNAKDHFSMVDGVSPYPGLHSFSMDIQPTMGMGLSAHVRMQLSLKISKSPALKQLMHLPLEDEEELLVPLMWFENSIDKPPDNLIIMLRDALATGDSVSQGVAIVGGISLLGQLAIFYWISTWIMNHRIEKEHEHHVVSGNDNQAVSLVSLPS